MQTWQLWIALSGVFASLTTTAFAEPYNPRIGQRHIAFTLPAIDDGRPISLREYHGKKVLLMQFASW